MLRGEKRQDVQTEEKGCYRLERSYGAFMRSIPLPGGLDLDQVDASLEQGVLTLRFRKADVPSPAVRKVEIR